MGKRLERLTAEQKALIPVVRDEWLAHGLSTEPMNRAEAERGVRLAYEAAGLAPPAVVVRLQSPLAGVIGQAILRQVGGQVRDQVGDQVRGQVGDQVRDQVWDQVGGQVWGQVRDQVWDQVGGQVRDQVWDQVRDQVWDQVGGQVRGQVRDQVWDQVGGQVRGQVWDQVRDQVRDQVWDWYRAVIYGQHEAGWLSFYDYFRRAAPTIAGPERLEGLSVVARNSGWWFGLEAAAILTERPIHLGRDDQSRLHDENGPAIAYPDGFGVWCWHGQRVPQWVIESPTPEKIGGENNIEIRRCAIESYGWDRYVQGWTPIDTCPDPGNGSHTLSLYDVPRGLWGEDVRVLVCTNGTPEPDGTPRKYGLAVPAHMSRALQAAAASYRVTEAEYATLGRRS